MVMMPAQAAHVVLPCIVAISILLMLTRPAESPKCGGSQAERFF